MTARVAVLALCVPLSLALPQAASAGPDRQVLLLITGGRPYEEVLRDPIVGRLTGAGGIGLMTTSGGAERPAQAAVTIGAGRTAAAAPAGPVPFHEAGTGLAVDARPYRAAAAPTEAGLLGSALGASGGTVGYLDLDGDGGDPAMLAAMDGAGRIPVAFLGPAPGPGRPIPEALRAVSTVDLLVSPDANAVPFVLEHTGARQLLVLVVSASASGPMRARGDTVTPVVLATGTPDELRGADGAPAGLTSDTTRRDGLVANVDVAPTVLDFLGSPVPGDMLGTAIRASGEPPTDLHRRYLAYRRVVTPVGVGALGFALVSLLAGLAVVFWPGRRPRRPAGWLAAVGLGSLALLVALLPASVLPSYAWPVAVASLVGAAAALVVLALLVGRGSPVVPVVAVAVGGLVLVVLDGLAGWPSGITPLLGGSALDGVRFYGLGNSYAGMVLAGAVLGAARLSARTGTALIVGASLFAGLPFLGADLGGGLTLAATAGVWWGLRRWRRLGWGPLAAGAAGFVAGLAVLVAAHLALPPGGTHVALVLEGREGWTGAVGVFVDRLANNLRTTTQTWPAWLAVLAIPVWLVVVLRPPGRLHPALADPTWRLACVTLAIGAMAGYVLNDTYGTANIAFVFLSGAVVYPALSLRWRGEETEGALRQRG